MNSLVFRLDNLLLLVLDLQLGLVVALALELLLKLQLLVAHKVVQVNRPLPQLLASVCR